MKLHRITEDDNRPEYEWIDSDPIPANGDPCPVASCRGVIKNRWRGMGAPSFRACKYGHAWKIDRDESQVARSSRGFSSKKEIVDLFNKMLKIANHQTGPETGVGVEHTCHARSRPSTDDLHNLGDGDEGKITRNRRVCKRCAAMYDALLDIEMDELVDPEAEKAEAERVAKAAEPKGELSNLALRLSELSPAILDKQVPPEAFQKLLEKDPRAAHQAGKFGTGRVDPVDIEKDSPIMALLKMQRDASTRRDAVTGAGRRAKYRDRCGHGHTCWDHPAGLPAQNFPLPDPMAGEGTGKYRYNNMFTEVMPNVDPRQRVDPWVQFRWPVSGLSGFKPKPQYMDYVMSKLNCKACTDPENHGCGNPVWQEYGQPKPFCKEHISEMPYQQELLKRHGEEALDASGDDPERVQKYEEWRKVHAENILPGDKVRWKFIPNSLRGKKADVGGGKYTQVYVIATGEAQEYDAERGWLIQYEWDSQEIPVYVNVGKGKYKKRMRVDSWDTSGLSGMTYLDADYLDVFNDSDPQDWEPGDPDAPQKIARG